MPINDVGFNPDVTVRRVYKVGINFSENAIFEKKCSKIARNGGFLEQNQLGIFMKRDRTTHNIQTRNK